MMAERGLSLAHTTIMRWVWRYAPELGLIYSWCTRRAQHAR
jgi:transposase-like protein